MWIRYCSDISDVSQRAMDDTQAASVSPQPATTNNLNNNNSTTRNVAPNANDAQVDANHNFRRSQSTTQQANRKLSNSSYPLMQLNSARGRSPSIPSTTGPAGGATFAGSPSFDQRLRDFLMECNCDAASIMAVVNQAFTYDDFVFGMQKDDLCRIGLK